MSLMPGRRFCPDRDDCSYLGEGLSAPDLSDIPSNKSQLLIQPLAIIQALVNT